jgi:hypothetical protein
MPLNRKSGLATANNLSDLASAAASRTNLGVFALMQFGVNANVTASQTKYIGQGLLADTANEVEFPITRDGVISRLFIRVPGFPVTNNVTYTLMVNGVATALVAVLSTTNFGANDTTHSVNVLAGDRVCVRAVADAGTSAVPGHHCSMEFAG